MKIYVNEQYQIISIDTEPDSYYEVFTVDGTNDGMLNGWCDACVQGFKYEPQYEMLFNEDGSNARDEVTGELLYKTDEEGNKIQNGYACYPFVDYKTLTLIQKQYEDSQKQVQSLNAQIEYLSMMSGIETEVADE